MGEKFVYYNPISHIELLKIHKKKYNQANALCSISTLLITLYLYFSVNMSVFSLASGFMTYIIIMAVLKMVQHDNFKPLSDQELMSILFFSDHNLAFKNTLKLICDTNEDLPNKLDLFLLMLHLEKEMKKELKVPNHHIHINESEKKVLDIQLLNHLKTACK